MIPAGAYGSIFRVADSICFPQPDAARSLSAGLPASGSGKFSFVINQHGNAVPMMTVFILQTDFLFPYVIQDGHFFSEVFRGNAEYRHCAAENGKYRGSRVPILISPTVVAANRTPTTAGGDGRDALPDLPPGIRGPVTGDKGYIGKAMCGELLSRGINLQTPFRTNMKDYSASLFCPDMRSGVQTGRNRDLTYLRTY